MTMMWFRLFLSTLLLFQARTVSALSREQREYWEYCSTVEKFSTEEEQDQRELRGRPRCSGGTETSWFNFEAEIKDISYNCDEKDRFILGALVSELVREVECSIPEYEDEIFAAELCETPSLSEDRRFLDSTFQEKDYSNFARHLGTSYTYDGGGRCKRCRKRRRSLRDLEELTKEAVCAYAATAKLGVLIAENSLSESYNNYEQVIDLASVFYDRKKGEKMVEEAEKKMLECEEHEKLAKREAEVSEEWCKLGVQDGSASTLKKALKEAEKTYKKSMDEATKAAESLHKVRDVKVKLMTEEIKYEGKQKEESLKRVVEKMKDDLGDRIDDYKKAIESKKKKKDKEQDKIKKATMEAELKVMESDKKKMEEESKQATKFLEQGAKMDTQIALLRAELTNADDDDDWLKKFSKLLEREMPKKLVYYYNETGGGCLDELVYPEAKVECWQVHEFEETDPFEKCELDLF